MIEALAATAKTVAATIAAEAIAVQELEGFAPALVVLVFCLVSGGAWLALRSLQRRPAVTVAEGGLDTVAPFGAWTEALAGQVPVSARDADEFQQLLRSAGLYRPGAAQAIYAWRFVLLVTPLVVAGAMAVVAGSDYTGPILIGGALLAGGLSVVPRLYVYFRRRTRQQRIVASLPDALDILGMCHSGGMGLLESLDYVARQLECYPELAEELRILRRQTEVGSLEAALADLAARVDVAEVRQLSQLLLRSERLGTQLAGSLGSQADELRQSRRQAATQRANKAPVKLVLPLLFCFAPAAVILLCGPAMIELKEFFAPSQGQSQISGRAAEGLGTGRLLSVLEELEQDVVSR